MLIAFVAPKQYGKSTACDILKKYWGDDVVRINFKDALVKELKQNFPDLLRAILEEEIETAMRLDGGIEAQKVREAGIDGLFVNKPPLIRTLMQNYGTEVRRGDRDSYWVDRWAESVVLATSDHTLTDDVRFINEAQKVKDLGGILIRLNRIDKTSTDTHKSETEQAGIKCDYTITVGEGEFTELEYQLKLIVDSL